MKSFSECEVVLAVFPGDVPGLLNVPQRLKDGVRPYEPTTLSLILIMHERDADGFPELERFVDYEIRQAFGRCFPRLEIRSFADLFDGMAGHRGSATAKQAALLSFMSGRRSSRNIIVVDAARLTAEGAVIELPCIAPYAVTDLFTLTKLEQAAELLNVKPTKSLQFFPSDPAIRFYDARHIADIDATLATGFKGAATDFLMGRIGCGLPEIYDTWVQMIPGSAVENVAVCLPIATSRCQADDILGNGKSPFGVDLQGEVGAGAHVATAISAYETFDSDFAHQAIALLNARLGGFVTFIQIGANDGRLVDPLLPFTHVFPWRGIVVEPVPFYFAELQERYADVVGVTPVQTAVGIGAKKRTMHFVSEELFNELENAHCPDWMRGIASFSRDHLLRHGVPSKFIQEIDVKVMSGKDLVKAYLADTAADLLIIDVEGAETEVIASFEFTGHLPTCVVFESEHMDAAELKQVECLLSDAGYDLHTRRPDAVAFRSGSSLANEFRTLMDADPVGSMIKAEI